jgi:DNA-binding NarL/FixJ family response regulator
MTINSKKIIVVDDHAIVREGLKMLLNSQENLELVAESDGSDDIIDLCLTNQPDLLMLDITLNSINGIELIKKIKKEHISTATIDQFKDKLLVNIKESQLILFPSRQALALISFLAYSNEIY